MGISENLGHEMTFSILNTTTNNVISRSNIRILGEPISPSLRIDPLTTLEVATSHHLNSVHIKDAEQAPDVI